MAGCPSNKPVPAFRIVDSESPSNKHNGHPPPTRPIRMQEAHLVHGGP
jgi:hypothetical protein